MNAEPPPGQPANTRVWLITGASSGLGRAIAEAALAAGDTVVAAARTQAAVDSLVAAHPGRAAPLELDVTDSTGIQAPVDDVLRRYGRVDVLVNSAGRALIGGVEETGDQELRDLMEVHFFGPAALTRAVSPHMRQQRSGATVQISSMGGRMSFAGVGAYSATKFALEGLSEALATEIAPFGIKVLIVEPGAFRTGLHRTGTRQQTTAMRDYDDIIGPVRAQQADLDGKQPGDPARAARPSSPPSMPTARRCASPWATTPPTRSRQASKTPAPNSPPGSESYGAPTSSGDPARNSGLRSR
jgi:NAD(P)-dependent dehydrogenase (short-subunit alcohol dehydrogenase family)